MNVFSTEVILAIIASVLASSGFWAWIIKRSEKKSGSTRLLMGLALDKIIFLGSGYIDRGWLSRDEYHDFRKYLYDPYRELGGNGSAEKMMEDIEELPIRSRQRAVDISFELETPETTIKESKRYDRK